LARNAAFDEARRRQRERSGLEEVVSLEAVRQRSEPGPDVTLSDDERRRLVQQAIRGLPAIYREPLVLRHLEDLSYREIAAVLGIPPDTVETRLVRARRLLREALGDGV
jgi:RNA polymerase sigma-70 factor (ECF subfamily)